MWIQNLFKSRNSTSSGRRPTRRSASRLCLEALQDRCLPSFYGPVNYPVDSVPLDPPAPLQDVNGDGYYDFASFSGGNVVAWLGNSDGTFRWAGEAGPISGYMTSGGGPGIGDFNGDGKFDLVATSTTYNDESNSTDYMDVWLGLGDGTFGVRTTYDIGGEQTSQLRVFDLDGNGRDDVLRVGIYGNQEIWRGQADGTFAGAPSLGGGYIYSVSHCDLNGDGRMDMIATTSNPGLSVYLGNSDGWLSYKGIYATGGVSPGIPLFADFDRDGRPDLAVLNGGSWDAATETWVGRSLVVLLGNGDGSFQAPQVLIDGPDAGLRAVADFNADGFPDVAVTVTDSEVAVLLNAADWPAHPPAIAVGDATVTEGNTGTRTATFLVTLDVPSDRTITVAYSTADGTATAGSDYQAASGTLTFAPGETSKTVTVTIIGDRLGEPNETFSLNLNSPTNATIANGLGVGTILDDEPRVNVNDVTRKEGNGGTTLFSFTVTLSAAYDVPVTVNFTTADGTAAAGEDYEAASGAVTFAPGETSKTVTIKVKGDKKNEADEWFYLDLWGATSAVFVDARGVGTILNDDR